MTSRRLMPRISIFVLSILGIVLFIQQVSYSQSNIVYMEIPAHLSKEQIVDMDNATRMELEQLTGQELSKKAPTSKIPNKDMIKVDLIIILTKNGQPILPDYETARKQILEKQMPPENELSFTFDSPNFPWTPSELDSLQKWLNDLYPTAKAIYGNPAFDITVNVKKTTAYWTSGIYNPSTNELTVRLAAGEDLTSKQDVIVHEIIHAFHDDNIIGFNNYEEGMTRAAEIEVFVQSGGYTHPWNSNHSYSYDVFYDGLNKPAVSGKNGNFWGGSALGLLRYQLAGYAWSKAYLEDTSFFLNFNQEYYHQLIEDPSVRFIEEKLKDIFRSIKSTIEGQTFDDWYSKQYIMNTNPDTGYTVYTRVNQYSVDYFYRNEFGYETPQSNAAVNWSVYDYSETLIDSGSGITNPQGVMNFFPNIPPGYAGKLKTVVSANSPGGEIKDISYRHYFSGAVQGGIFGIVPGENQGNVWIIGLDNPTKKEIQPLVNGAFSFPIFENVRGCFAVIYTNLSGEHFVKIITKDASHYFVNMDSLNTLLFNKAIHKEIAKHFLLEDKSIESISLLAQIPKPSKIRSLIPLEFAVDQNYPNPFNPNTKIRYAIPQNDKVTIVIYNAVGQKVKTLTSEYHEAGYYTVTWDATNEAGYEVSSGIYFYRVTVGEQHNAIKKMTLLR